MGAFAGMIISVSLRRKLGHRRLKNGAQDIGV